MRVISSIALLLLAAPAHAQLRPRRVGLDAAGEQQDLQPGAAAAAMGGGGAGGADDMLAQLGKALGGGGGGLDMETLMKGMDPENNPLLKGMAEANPELARMMQDPEAMKQQMGNVPDSVGRVCSPFLETGVDLFGPLLAKGLGGHARKVFKAWGVMFVCLGSRAVSMWLSPSYSCHDFLLCLQHQVAIYGKPPLFKGLTKDEIKDQRHQTTDGLKHPTAGVHAQCL